MPHNDHNDKDDDHRKTGKQYNSTDDDAWSHKGKRKLYKNMIG